MMGYIKTQEGASTQVWTLQPFQNANRTNTHDILSCLFLVIVIRVVVISYDIITLQILVLRILLL